MGLTEDLPGDSESKREGIAGRILLELALAKILPQILDDHPDLIFMQDSAGIHRWKEIGTWLKEKGYRRTVWPPYSPDLNPIEHVNLWAESKKLVYELHPELYSMRR